MILYRRPSTTLNVEVTMEEPKGSFFDQRTILAIVLVGVVWFAWQSYLTKKYPDYGKPVQKAATTSSVEKKDIAPEAKSINQTSDSSPHIQTGDAIIEKLIPVDNDVLSFKISSRGMGLKDMTLKKYKDRENQPVQIGSETAGLFEMRLNGQPLNFEIETSTNEKGERLYIGRAKQGSMELKRTLVVGNTYFIPTQLAIENPNSDVKNIQVLMADKKISTNGGSLFSPATEIQEFVFGTGPKFDRVPTHSKESVDKSAGLFDVAGISSHYFAAAYSNESEVVPEVFLRAHVEDKDAGITASYKPVTLNKEMVFPATLFAGPKDTDIFHAAVAGSRDLTPLVNFGFFGVIGKVLLSVLQFFHEHVVSNWGLAIIFLTLLVRLIVLPFNIASYKSMKKMQRIQPMIQSLRDRYKDDPTTMNAEMMKLMKDQKVNPLGGCLPMLLQMPVFFALYQVLGQSIELYQAPFFGWIHDLSLKDPYFVLPVLMSITMWYNQKITPTTMDPAQAKMMQFLPLVFGVMMVALPSGLTLYMFVSTLFGIVQQQLFMRERTATFKPTVKTV